MNRFALSIWLVAGLGAAPPRATAQGAVAVEPAPMDSSDALRPGDLIRLRVWREPDFTGDFPVDESGVVLLPRLGAINVAALHPESLKVTLIREYQAFLTHTAVDVEYLRRVQVRGAVQKPGVYHVEPGMRVSDVLALAGGVVPNGREDRVQIFRDGVRLPATISGLVEIARSPVRSGDQLYVPERSWFSRNTGVVLGGISAVTTFLYVVLHR